MTNALKGHAMNRGTLMVLKRLMVTTLGALGLGALLATGTAFAQIPAPDDLAPPGAPDPDVTGCTAATAYAEDAADTVQIDVSVCTGDMADAAQPVDAARAAQAAVDAAQTVVDTAEDALETAKEGTDQVAIATAQNTLDSANIRLDAAKAARDNVIADSALAKAALAELNAIQMVTATATAQTEAEGIRDRTGTDLAALEFDADGNNVATGGTAIGSEDDAADASGSLWAQYNAAVERWNLLEDDADEDAKAAPAQNIVDTKHALNAAMNDASYVALKATFDAQDKAAVDAAKAHADADTAKADAGAAIIAGLAGTPPSVAADDDTADRIARIVDDLAVKRDAAVKDRDAKQALATEASDAQTEAETDLTNANTRLANATAAYNTAAEEIADDGTRPAADTDELAALVAAEIEYAEAYFGQQAATMAVHNAITANDDAQMALTDAETAVTNAQNALDNPSALAYVFDPDNPAADLTDALLSGEDTGGALVDAVDDLYEETEDNEDRLDALLAETETMVPVLDADGNPVLDEDGNPMMVAATTESGRIVEIETKIEALSGDDGTGGQVAQNSADIAALTAEDDPATEDVDETGAVTANTNDIEDLDGRVATNEEAITQETTARMEADAAEATARGEADTALGGRIDSEEAARIAADTAEMTARMEADAAEATAREAADTALGGRIDSEEAARIAADTAEMTARMEADTMLGGRIDAEAEARASGDMTLSGMIGDEATARMGADAMLGGRIDSNASSISSNADAIAANMNSIGSNASAISDNRNMIGELSDDLDVVRAGVAASMALAGMPAINGRGISIGVGSFDGESAFAVGFQIQGEMASFKVGVTSGGGATGASAGVGFQF